MKISAFTNVALRLKDKSSTPPSSQESREDRTLVGKFKCLNTELQIYLCAISSARLVGALGKEDLNSFLNNHFAIVELSLSSLSSTTVAYVSNIMDSMEFFVEFCPLIWAQAHGLPSATLGAKKDNPSFTPLPLSMWNDKFRLCRALLRFQLYCELFHQPGDSSDSISDWEERIPEQEHFWLRYKWWEVEEVKCICQVLVFCLESFDPLPGHATSYIGSSPQLNNLQQRGLPQLRNFLDDSTTQRTTFGESYVRRFLARAFHGFKTVDPENFSWFSRLRPVVECHDHSIYVPCAGTDRSAKDRRWDLSPYPGVRLQRLVNLARVGEWPYECRMAGNAKGATVTF